MNHRITPTSPLASLMPVCAAIATARGRPVSEKYELEDNVLRGTGWAEPIGEEAASLHAQIVQIEADAETARIAAAALPPTVEALRQRIAFRRWQEETEGITVDLGGGRSLPIETDGAAQGKLTGLLVIASAQPVAISWKGSDGVFVAITNPDVTAMATAVFAHIQTCFAREAALLVLLADVETVEERAAFVPVVEQFWAQ